MAPVEKIVSGGQTGVDRAALDTAMESGIPCGGWCPKGRRAEDGPIGLRYPLDETPSVDYNERTAWNVRDSSGTLVLTWGTLAGGTAYTVKCARNRNRPCLIVDIALDSPEPEPVIEWIGALGIRVLNVAGPRGSRHPAVYSSAAAFLREILRAVPR